jgi:hypothetical protein
MMGSRLRAGCKWQKQCNHGNDSTHTVFLRLLGDGDRDAIKGRVIQWMVTASGSTMSRGQFGRSRLRETPSGQNVAKECSNNNEICAYAWNVRAGVYCAQCSIVDRQRAASAIKINRIA